jgi:hypothetical protein
VLRQFPHAIGWTCASGSDLRWVILKLNPQPRHRSTTVTACSYLATHESCLGRPDHAVLGATVAGNPTSHGRYTAVFSGALHPSYRLAKEVHLNGSRLVVRQVVFLALLGCQLSSCSTWRMVTVPPEQALAGRPEQVRVTRAAGDRVVLINPEVCRTA